MSGPKVVRIVTREEILAICEAELARLDAALRDWIRVGQRNDCLSNAEIETAGVRRDELAALISTDRFMDFQKGAGQEMAFLASDLQVRLAKVAEEKAEKMAGARRQREAARALLGALRTKKIQLPESLTARLEAIAGGASDPAAMADGFAALSPGGDLGAADRKRLAELHKTGAAGVSLADWMSERPPPADEARLMKVDRRLADLQSIGTAGDALLATREAAGNEPDERRRALLLDSLELEVVALVSDAKARAALETELYLCLAELAAFSSESHARLEARRFELTDGPALAALLKEVKTAIEVARNAIATEARREAILTALLSLGYEVTEGMETAWANEGQVVLRSAARPDYGVEIVGKAENERLQMRAIAFEDGEAAMPDASRDRDAETIWCGEVGALRQQLARAGTTLDIVKARAVGEVPLKRVRSSKEIERRREGRVRQTKTLK